MISFAVAFLAPLFLWSTLDFLAAHFKFVFSILLIPTKIQKENLI